MRTSDRHASLSADRSSFVAYIREFSSCRMIYQQHHPHQVWMHRETLLPASGVCCKVQVFYFAGLAANEKKVFNTFLGA